MKGVYVLDASAWLKRYHDESGSNQVDKLFEQAEQGHIVLCLLPLVYYEVYWRVQRFIRTVRNHSSPTPPRLRYKAQLLVQVLGEDTRLMKRPDEIVPNISHAWNLAMVNQGVVDLMREYPLGPNDAFILIMLRDLSQALAVHERPLIFVCSDTDLNDAAKQFVGDRHILDPAVSSAP